MSNRQGIMIPGAEQSAPPAQGSEGAIGSSNVGGPPGASGEGGSGSFAGQRTAQQMRTTPINTFMGVIVAERESRGTNADFSAPSGVTNGALIYAIDNGAGKTKLMVVFGTGAAVQIAIEP